jgi:hypothetical protein
MDGKVRVNAVERLVVSNAAYGNGQRCVGGGCPAVFRTDQDTFFVVGRRLSAAEKTGLPMDGIEDALEVPRELLLELAAQLKQE